MKQFLDIINEYRICTKNIHIYVSMKERYKESNILKYSHNSGSSRVKSVKFGISLV